MTPTAQIEMQTFPFPEDTINNNRFHGLLQGKFELIDGYLNFRTTHGLIRLYKRPGDGGGRPFRAARLQLENFPDSVINLYGYPRTDKDGVIRRFEMMSWFREGSDPPENNNSIARRFTPGQMFLCGRVRRIEDGLITVKVKSTVAGKEFRWLVTGQLAGSEPRIGSKVLFSGGLAADGLLVVRPVQEISPPGKSSASPASFRARPLAEGTSTTRSSQRSQRPSVSGVTRTAQPKQLRRLGTSSADSSDRSAQPSPPRSQNPPARGSIQDSVLRRPVALQRPQL